jgi:hypothetical protein
MKSHHADPLGKPIVRLLRGRADATYARSGNVILPLAFAQRMPGWRLTSGAGAPALPRGPR